MVDRQHPVTFVYRNYKGEIEERIVVAPEFRFGKSPYHKDMGDAWFIHAYDTVREAYRDFLLDDVLTPMRTYVQAPEKQRPSLLSDMLQEREHGGP